MVPSLSIVLPVHNAEAKLAEQVCQLLEVLPDLADRFELVVVDDGSTDLTSEFANDLTQRFPQMRLVRHARRRGAAAAIQTGINAAQGEFVMVQDASDPISPADLRRLWAMRHDEELIVARTEPKPATIDAGLLSRLMNWGRGVERAAAERPSAHGTQMIRRAAMQELAANPSLQNLKLAREHGAEKIARIVPRRKGTGLVTHLRDFALGE